MKLVTILWIMVPGIGCYLGLIDGGYGVIEEIKTPADAGALMSRLSHRSKAPTSIPQSRTSSLLQPRLPAPHLKVLIERSSSHQQKY